MLGLLMNVHEAPQRGWSRSRDPRSSWIARTAVRVGAQPFATVRRRERRATFGIEIRLGLTDRADDIQPQRRARKNAPPRDSSTTANANVAIAATVRRAAAPTRDIDHTLPQARRARHVLYWTIGSSARWSSCTAVPNIPRAGGTRPSLISRLRQ